MSIARISIPARVISVLLGGSGICQPRAEADVAALLLPRKRRTSGQPCRSPGLRSILYVGLKGRFVPGRRGCDHTQS
jgi:hypothetical protein